VALKGPKKWLLFFSIDESSANESISLRNLLSRVSFDQNRLPMKPIEACWNGLDPHTPLQWHIVHRRIPGSFPPRKWFQIKRAPSFKLLTNGFDTKKCSFPKFLHIPRSDLILLLKNCCLPIFVLFSFRKKESQ
jgi:hypothetical protein